MAAGKLKALVSAKPWILPVLYILVHAPRPMAAGEIAGSLGVRSAVVRRALWWLSKTGIIGISSSTPRRYWIKESYLEGARELLDNAVRRGNSFLIIIGKHYVVATARPRGIRALTIPASLVSGVERVLREAPEACFRPLDVAEALGIPLKLASTALRIMALLGEAVAEEGCYRAV